MSINDPQPAPVKNEYPSMWKIVVRDAENFYSKGYDKLPYQVVLSDMKEREKIGIKKYNTILQPFNGRNPLMDAYQESLDLAVYLRQAIFEKESGKKEEIKEDLITHEIIYELNAIYQMVLQQVYILRYMIKGYTGE